MVATISLLDGRIYIFELIYVSYFTSDFDQVRSRLHSLIMACISDSIVFNVVFALKIVFCCNSCRFFVVVVVGGGGGVVSSLKQAPNFRNLVSCKYINIFSYRWNLRGIYVCLQ